MSSTLTDAQLVARSVLVASSIGIGHGWPGKREAIALPSTEPSDQRAKLRTTSSAVKASPLFQVTPGRTFRVYSVASALASQLSSRRPSKRAVGVVLDQIFQPAAIDVGDLRPVGQARVFLRLRLPSHTRSDAADLGSLAPWPGLRRPDQAVGSSGRDAQRGGAGQEFAAAEFAVAQFVRIHLGGRMQSPSDGSCLSSSSPCQACAFSYFRCAQTRAAMGIPTLAPHAQRSE